MLDFGREMCGDPRWSTEREWLVTNGIGGYASGTVAGVLTRRYHGLLVAALKPPVRRTLLLVKLDETASYGGQSYPLFANHWAGGELEPAGFRHLERFRLEGTTPVWTYALADALLEKRVWMQPGSNTTYVRYEVQRGSGPLELHIKAIVDDRDHHANTQAGAKVSFQVERVNRGLRVSRANGRTPLYLLCDGARSSPEGAWYRGYYLAVEEYRGLDPLDDNYFAGRFEATLVPGESLTLVASTEAGSLLDGDVALAGRRAYEEALIERARPHLGAAPPAIEQLVLAADQFVVQRALPGSGEGESATGGRSIIAGYPWFSDWGRDTMISLPGLVLTAGRPEVAARILRTFAQYVSEGMLPNRFPDEGHDPEYNTVDATLWYFEAIRACYEAAHDLSLLRDLWPVLQDIIDWHVRGTRYQIHLDPADGLLYAGEPGVQLTWMDAKVDDWVVTPRIGKPVEVNALWYNALQVIAALAPRLGESPREYQVLAQRAAEGFARFWNRERGFCYDVLDGPEGDDPALRPNQIFAVSLPHSPLPEAKQRAVIDACARHLLTSHGLRSLAPDGAQYEGRYGGDRKKRDAAYHQGTVWGWLIGSFVEAHLRVYRDPATARSFLWPLLQHLDAHGLGSISEIFDGDPPFTPRGCIAQAWSVAGVLRAWQAVADLEGGRSEGMAPREGDRGTH
jgi:predicted glycogen debranching enzyme